MDGSEISMLVDYIAVKVKKQDKELAWDQVGYDVANFSLPRRGQVKSNFIKYTPPAPVQQPLPKEEEPLNDKENTNSTNLESTATAEPEKPKNVDLPRHNRQLCHLNLESMN